MNENITIYIDSSDNQSIRVGIQTKDGADIVEKILDTHKAQIILPLIVETLQKHTLTIEDVSGITVVKGPGSFTGLRVGISIANALSYLLQVPVNEQVVGTIVEPVY